MPVDQFEGAQIGDAAASASRRRSNREHGTGNGLADAHDLGHKIVGSKSTQPPVQEAVIEVEAPSQTSQRGGRG